MNVLENWIIELLEKPIEILDDRYENDTIVMGELNALPLPKTNGHPVSSSYVFDEVLHKLHGKIREQPCEDAIWQAVLWFLAHPLPITIAHDLIDRLVATSMMGFTRQVDEVQWRLATFDSDALYTLITERYQEMQFSTRQFQQILQTYQYNIVYEGILYMLSYRTPSSPEKEAIYLAAVEEEQERINERQHQDDSDSSSNHLEDD